MTTGTCGIAVIGAGIAGIATAHALVTRYGQDDVVLIDEAQPMALTSAQSGENYRNWWPHETMARFTDHSIDLMEQLAREGGDRFHMTRRGYALATREMSIESLVAQLYRGYGEGAADKIRFHERGCASGYRQAVSPDWRQAPDGVDVITDPDLIRRAFPSFDPAVTAVIHIRRAGDISGQQLGQQMLERYRAAGGRRLTAKVRALSAGPPFRLDLETPDGSTPLTCRQVVNAAGPYAGEIAAMLGVDLPLRNVLQQKIAFEDAASAIPRAMPFSIDLDDQSLDWSDEERALIREDASLAWLAETMPGAIHCRPDGGDCGRWIKLGWAFNKAESSASRTPELNDHFPEIVLRGAARLNPALRHYYGSLPGTMVHYGGFYTMTEENWPLIGPLGIEGAYLVAALSGFGTMAACAAGDLCAAWLAGARLPDYAMDLSPARLAKPDLLADLRSGGDKGLL